MCVEIGKKKGINCSIIIIGDFIKKYGKKKEDKLKMYYGKFFFSNLVILILWNFKNFDGFCWLCF